jgi:aspartyl-tRNA(Asn)/glutamyl-tRNA(Gln) amidotransferase subunit C
MSLTLNDVTRIANLAKLKFPTAEANSTLDKLNGIFLLAEQLKALIPLALHQATLSAPCCPNSHCACVKMWLLKPIIATNTKQAPATQDGLYLVPKVIE